LAAEALNEGKRKGKKKKKKIADREEKVQIESESD
jgi:hypothetical protein